MTAELQTIFTIGVYGSTEESFFGALVENEIELFIDISGAARDAGVEVQVRE